MRGSIFDVINNSKKIYDKIYIIDSYREPVSRKISSFFQNLNSILDNYYNIKGHLDFYLDNIDTHKLMKIFTEFFLIHGENYHSMDEVCCFYGIPYITDFNFKQGYIKIEYENIVLIKFLFKNIQYWDKYLFEFFNKQFDMKSNNLSIKNYNMKYNDFLLNYKIDKNMLIDLLSTDKHFKIFTTEDERDTIIERWSDVKVIENNC